MTEPRVALVTGAAARIGACIARRFHVAGFAVVVHYKQSREQAEQLVAGLNDARPDSARALQADLCEAQQVEWLGQAALQAFGRVDVLVNNASAFYATPFHSSTRRQWNELLDSNLRGAYFLSQALAEDIARHRGAIVNIVDIHGDRPLKRFPIYSIAKAGLKSMTRALALELAPAVRVNGVAPGAILWPESLADDSDPEVLQSREKVLASIALGRLGKPEDIADSVYFLAESAAYISGQVIRVDGGRHLA